ncbi:uncharacterized protein LOC143908997 [Arctopsyche grandis]|uniref:uncharacterized protein LOC143908997 n=1 Tax=Arctopsyche grandis TaxID=121162 RepID=UPI00406D96C4
MNLQTILPILILICVDRSKSDLSHLNCTSRNCTNATCKPKDSANSEFECTCKLGYHKSITENSCKPICDKRCINGECTDPNTCTCFKNYILDTADQYKCNPTCPTPCINGFCSSPGKCSCNQGYSSVGSNMTCEPFCEDCSHGKCIKPNFCKCDEGYKKSRDGGCEAYCYGNCENGVCRAPDNCVCSAGYTMSDKGKCVLCDGGCENALCVKGICVCNEGYNKTYDGKCLPICQHKCVNGKCIAPDVCGCFNSWDGPDCTDVKITVEILKEESKLKETRWIIILVVAVLIAISASLVARHRIMQTPTPKDHELTPTQLSKANEELNAEAEEHIYTEIDEFPISKYNEIKFSSEIPGTIKSLNSMNVDYAYDIPKCI